MRVPGRWICAVAYGCATSVAFAAAPVAVEFAHAGYGHYFVTASPAEIARLDAGVIAGWARTGEAYAVLAGGTPGAADVCRFWSGATFAPKSSHFYTPVAAECASVQANAAWTYEGVAFAVAPTSGDGACVSPTLPLYRLYNDGQGGAPNHRYTVRTQVRAEMLAAGWIAEGAGAGVIGCLPPASARQTTRGHVAPVAGAALVCIDENRNGRCDDAEPQSYADADGAWAIDGPAEAQAPLVAEVHAAGAAYRMASPSPGYASDITPYTTLVQLARAPSLALGEDRVRDLVGLPPKFDLRLTPGEDAASLKSTVAQAIAAALAARGNDLDLASPGALEAVVAAFPASLTTLPRLVIETKDRAPIVSREEYIDATYVLTNPAAAVPEAALNGKIRGRGNSTWGQPKNPYKVQFANDASYAALVDVLGMKKQRNWALLADYFDRTLIRNKLALSLGSSAAFADGLKWTPSGQHVEVVLNGDYVGVYLLTEDIRIDPARLALKKMSTEPARNEVDGGYIVEVDVRLDCYGGPDANLQLVTPQGVSVCVDTPDESAITPAQLAYIRQYVVDAETELYGAGRMDRLNPASYADWYLLQELFRNNDAIFVSSDFMWKDTAAAENPADRVLNMGPLWDFDRSAGNVNDFGNWEIEGCWVAKPYEPNWINRLLRNPDFLALTLERWQAKRAALADFIATGIDTYVRRLRGAQERNFARWPILGVQLTNHYAFATYDEEVAFLRRYLEGRMAWLDRAYASPGSFDALCR